MGNFFNKPENLEMEQILESYGIIPVEKMNREMNEKTIPHKFNHNKSYHYVEVNGKYYCSENNIN